MIRVLVTGANGQLGRSIRRLAEDFPQYETLFTDIEEMDILDEEEISRQIEAFHPDCIVNCAAYTAVDKAEEDETNAFALNASAVGNLARAAKTNDILLIHISTDYIFSGTAYRPVTEDEKPDPRSAYARSKFAGEQEIMKEAGPSLIIRTSWLYSEFGKNFAKTILNKAEEKNELKVIFDQSGTPTYAGDLAEVILRIIPLAKNMKGTEILNYSNEGTASWYDFAYAITSLAGIKCRIIPVRTEDYPLPAKRPFFSVLDKTRIRTKYKIKVPHWYESLKIWYGNIKSENHED